MGQEKVTLSPTEIVDPAGREFDRLPVALQLERLLASQAQAVEAIRKITDQLAAAVEAATDHLRGSEGRLVYAGAVVPFGLVFRMVSNWFQHLDGP